MIENVPNWFSNLLVCLECDSEEVVQEDTVLRCFSCATLYPICNSVPLLLKKNSFVDAAQTIGRNLGGISADDVQTVFGTALRYRLNDLTLRGEFTNIVERYANIIPDLLNIPESNPKEQFKLITQYFNTTFLSNETCYRSFRIRNNSQTTWISTGSKPWNISYILYDLDDTQRYIEGVRSAFPIPLPPSHELTIPVRIVVPSKIGRYRIVVKLVQEFVGWVDPPVFETEIDIVNKAVDRPELVNNPHKGFFDFSEDIQQCGKILRRAVAMLHAGGVKRPLRVLEVACGNDPQTLRHYQPETLVVACDVAFPQVQFGALQYAAGKQPIIKRENYQFVAANVYNAPFKSGAFDLVVISAALHHFVDVTDALVRLSIFLQSNGLLVIMREPCKVFPEDETFIKELLNGFNEQQFELEEYDEMFQRARLKRLYEQIDYECSYKAILAKNTAT